MEPSVVQVIGDAGRSGGPQHVLNLSRGLRGAGLVVRVVCPPGPMVGEFRKAGLEVTTISMRGKFDLGAVLRLRKYFRRLRNGEPSPTVVHCHGVRAGFLGRIAALGLGLPVVYTEHLWTSDYHLRSWLNEVLQLWWLKMLDRETSQTIAVSKAVRDFLVNRQIVPSEKISVIYHGVPFPAPSRRTTGNVRLSYRQTRSRILFVGSLANRKNPRLFIEAIEIIRQEFPEVMGELIGGGPLFFELERLIKRRGLERNILLRGEVARPAVFFPRATLLVHPAADEAFGLSVLEAMHHGIVPVASKVGGLPEVIGRAGRLVPPGDSQAFAQAALDLLRNPELRSKLSQAAKTRARKFSIAKMTSQHLRLYRLLVSKRTG